jgi:hypothetical protein
MKNKLLYILIFLSIIISLIYFFFQYKEYFIEEINKKINNEIKKELINIETKVDNLNIDKKNKDIVINSLKKENKNLIKDNKNFKIKIKEYDILLNKKENKVIQLEKIRKKIDLKFKELNNVFTLNKIKEKEKSLYFKTKKLEYNMYFLEKILNEKINIVNKAQQNKSYQELYELKKSVYGYKKEYKKLTKKINDFTKKYKRLKSDEAKNLLNEIDYLENTFTFMEEKFDKIIENDKLQDLKIKRLNYKIDNLETNTNLNILNVKKSNQKTFNNLRKEINVVYDEVYVSKPYIAKTLVKDEFAIIDNKKNRLTLKINLETTINKVKYKVIKIDENCVYLKNIKNKSENLICK